jgi:hypothetical protein
LSNFPCYCLILECLSWNRTAIHVRLLCLARKRTCERTRTVSVSFFCVPFMDTSNCCELLKLCSSCIDGKNKVPLSNSISVKEIQGAVCSKDTRKTERYNHGHAQLLRISLAIKLIALRFCNSQ